MSDFDDDFEEDIENEDDSSDVVVCGVCLDSVDVDEVRTCGCGCSVCVDCSCEDCGG